MTDTTDVASILPFLPLITRSSSFYWPPRALASLTSLSLGPDVSHVTSGEILFDFILDLRHSLALSADRLAHRAADGYTLFFDELMSRMDAMTWFGDVVPELARLLLRMPALLDAHYVNGQKYPLRLLGQQEAGVVILSQELIAAILACGLLCLFPSRLRAAKKLSAINFDHLFAALHRNAKQSQEHKVKCIVHYFERVCLHMPAGYVSFERKVLALEDTSDCISYPDEGFWRTSVVPLCPFKVFSTGTIEDQHHEALEVDFANEYLGGGALHRGCVQEEIRFMLNPELIAGILFMAFMSGNEAIEIVGVERFSSYMGYGSSFRFVGDYLDKRPFDTRGRRRTKIVAIDALHNPGMRQYGEKCLLRETNKGFCGFYDSSKYQNYLSNMKHAGLCKDHFHRTGPEVTPVSHDDASIQVMTLDNSDLSKTGDSLELIKNTSYDNCEAGYQDKVGISTGNWGCGAFGGDPEIKCMIQWLAASQALRPFIHYYTFELSALQNLDQVTEWILLHKWTVGDLWNMLVEYSSKRLNRETRCGFLSWLLPKDETSSGVQFMCED